MDKKKTGLQVLKAFSAVVSSEQVGNGPAIPVGLNDGSLPPSSFCVSLASHAGDEMYCCYLNIACV
jgi:hypothetical protein